MGCFSAPPPPPQEVRDIEWLKKQQKHVAFTEKEINKIASVRDSLNLAGMAYYFAMGAVLFSAFIGYIEDYRITYDELIVAVCDAINFFGLAYICQSAASRFGSGDRFAQGSNPRANSAGKGNSDDINKILAVLGDLDELYSHLRAAWMLNAILRLVKITKAGGEQGARHVVSAVAIVSSIALLDRVMDLFPGLDKDFGDLGFNPISWVADLVAPRASKTGKKYRSKVAKKISAAIKSSGPAKQLDASKFPDALGVNPTPAFTKSEMEARAAFNFLPDQTPVITELVSAMTLSVASASMMLFAVLAETIATALATIEDPKNFPNFLSATLALYSWYQTRSSILLVAKTFETTVLNDAEGTKKSANPNAEDLRLLITALGGADDKDGKVDLNEIYSMSQQFENLSTTAIVVAVSRSVIGIWSLMGMMQWPGAKTNLTVQGKILKVITRLVAVFNQALQEDD